MSYDKQSGKCKDGSRHKWDLEHNSERISSGWGVTYYIPCLKCGRLKVVRYGNRGNSIAGYANKVSTPPGN